MEYKHLIHDFIDGSLDKASEDQLFLAMASNEDFRSELRNTIKIDKALKARVSDFAPAATSTINIFNKLGIDSPAFVAARIPFYKKYAQAIYSSIATIAVAVVIYFSMLQPNPVADQNFAQNATDGGDLSAVDQNFLADADLNLSDQPGKLSSSGNNSNATIRNNSNLPVVSSNDNHSGSSAQTVATANKDFNSAASADDDSFASVPASDNSANRNFYVLVPVRSADHSNFDLRDQFGAQFSNLRKENISSLMRQSDEKARFGVDLELKGNQLVNLNSDANSIPVANSNLFENYQISAFYYFNSMFAVGVDVRSERLFRDIAGARDFNSYVTYSLVARHSIANFSQLHTKLFGQVAFGFNGLFTDQDGGFVVRPMLGCEYTVTPRFSFVVGVESNHFGYRVQDAIQSSINFSDKIGINYGINYKL